MHRTIPASLVLAAALAAGVPAAAQQAPAPVAPRAPAPPQAPPVAAPPVVVYQNPANAREVQQQLRAILDAYPPTLRQLLRLDPSLMQRDDYLSAYPALAAFLQQHPEVGRNPAFYFGEQYFEREQTDRERTLGLIRNTLDGIGFLTAFLTVVVLLYSLLRQALEHRRWRRQIQIQTEVHTKLLDRMTNNQELLAYIETPAGRRFLEAPVVAQSPSASTLAPVARIMWSVQIGTVLVAAGIGFWIARTTIDDAELVSVFQVMGSLAMAVGVGFVVSALLSWALSLRMGLLSASPAKAE